MEFNESTRRLYLFGIVGENTDIKVVSILARLLTSGAITLGELQTARDIVKRKSVVDPWAYVFLAAMFLSLHGGNTYLDCDDSVQLILKAGYIEDESSEHVQEFRDLLNGIGSDINRAAVPLDGDVIVNDGGHWFFKKNLSAVRDIRKKINEMMDVASPNGFVTVSLSDEELARAVSFTNPATGKSYNLNAEQKSAVAKVATQRLTVVTGGPGTGKTTVVCSFLRALVAKGVLKASDVAIAAPTGRAAQRMGEAISKQCAGFGEDEADVRCQIESLKGTTIHSLLGGYPPEWKHTAKNPLPQKLVIIDESSMVDVYLMQALLAAIADDCRLVLLGDGDQLPSVDAGAVLGDLVDGANEASVVRLVTSNRFTGALAACANAINDKTAGLTEEMRYKNFVASSIPVAVEDLNDWTAPLRRQETENSCFRLALPENARIDTFGRLIEKWAESFGLLGESENGLLAMALNFPKDDLSLKTGKGSEATDALFAALDSSRILTVVRNGAFGAIGVNEFLVKKRFGGRVPSNPFAKAGVPVLITRNTRARNLFNGDIGVTVEGPGGIIAIFARGKDVVTCPVDLLPEHDLAYAITVHKSQGSEFGNVLVVLPNRADHPLLSRELVYTGITRAKKRAVVMGAELAISTAIKAHNIRNTGVLKKG
jgi:exodeoxyribonuclease V alpha subunit